MRERSTPPPASAQRLGGPPLAADRHRSQCSAARWALLAVTLLLAAPTRAATPVEIEFTGWHDPQLLQSVIDRFNAENPEIKVSQTTANAAKILTRIAAGDPPDVYRVSWAEFLDFADKGLALDLNRLIERDRAELRLNDFWPPALAAFNVNGVQLAMPHHIGGNLIWVNLDAFAAGGLPAPQPGWTYSDDFWAIARKLTKDVNNDGNVDQWGFANPTHWAFWTGLIHSDGGSLYNADQTAFVLNTPIAQGALQYLLNLVQTYRAAPISGVGEAQWRNGQAAMILGPAVLDNYTNVSFSVTVVPNPQGKVRRVMMGGPQPLIIYPGSKHIEAAWRFIKYVNRPDIQAWISNQGIFPPTRRSAVPAVKSPLMRTFGMEMENQVVYTRRLHNDILSLLGGRINAVLQGKLPIPQALSEAEQLLNQRLREARQGGKAAP